MSISYDGKIREREEQQRRRFFLLKICITGILFLLCLFFRPQPAQAKVRLAIVDTDYGGDCSALARMFRTYGASVTWIHSPRDIKPGKYDGLLIPGGADIHPKCYREKVKGARRCNKKKDRLQLQAIGKFANAGKPILGICRGEQLINVYYGGSLYQNISPRRHTGKRKSKITDCRDLLGAFPGKTITAYHSHHQAVKQAGAGIVITERDVTYGYVEGIAHESLPIYGLGWHPEHSSKPVRKKVAKAFLKACRR